MHVPIQLNFVLRHGRSGYWHRRTHFVIAHPVELLGAFGQSITGSPQRFDLVDFSHFNTGRLTRFSKGRSPNSSEKLSTRTSPMSPG